jgi:hypothetical protein
MICWRCHSNSVNTGSRLPICSDVKTRKRWNVVGIDDSKQPYWLKLWRPSCQKLLSPWNFYIIEMMTGLSSAKFDIFLPIAYPRWPPQSNLVYHWNLWEFHWKTFLWETTRQIEYFALYKCSLDGSTPDLLFWCRSEITRANNVFWLVETLKIFLSETTRPMEL